MVRIIVELNYTPDQAEKDLRKNGYLFERHVGHRTMVRRIREHLMSQHGLDHNHYEFAGVRVKHVCIAKEDQ